MYKRKKKKKKERGSHSNVQLFNNKKKKTLFDKPFNTFIPLRWWPKSKLLACGLEPYTRRLH
jgi:hypothetical protein